MKMQLSREEAPRNSVKHFYLLQGMFMAIHFLKPNGHNFLEGAKIQGLGIIKKINGWTVQPFYSIFYSIRREGERCQTG
jgi:hypothetical protein